MNEKSYFEAMFGELSNGDGGNTFSLPNKNFISPPRLDSVVTRLSKI